MSRAHATVEGGPGDHQIVEEHGVEDRYDEHVDGGSGGRRWYRLRPEPRRRADLMGFNSAWWMALGWLILILLVVFPFPFWSW